MKGWEKPDKYKEGANDKLRHRLYAYITSGFKLIKLYAFDVQWTNLIKTFIVFNFNHNNLII